MDESVSEGRSQAVFLRWKKCGFGDLSERAESRSTPRFADLRGVDACGPLVDARDVTVGPRKNRRTFFKRSSDDGTTTLFFFSLSPLVQSGISPKMFENQWKLP